MPTLRDHLSRLMPPGVRAQAVALERRVQRLLGRSGPMRQAVRRRQLALHLRRPYHVAIEITAACNARCIMCPRHLMDRAMRPMNFDLFRKIVDDCAAIGVREVALNGYGEIFTMRRDLYRKYIDYLRRAAPDIHVVVNTNAFEMDEAAARYLVEAGVHTVHSDIDGATAETFEHVRQYLKLAQVEENVLRLVRIRNELGKTRPVVHVGIIGMRENVHEIPAFLAKWRGKVDYVNTDGFMNRMGDPDFPKQFMDQGRPCYDLWSRLNVWADGKAVLCCEDWNAQHVVGDATTQTVAGIWRGAALEAARRRHLAAAGHSIPLCSSCNYWRKGPYWWFDEWATRTGVPEPLQAGSVAAR